MKQLYLLISLCIITLTSNAQIQLTQEIRPGVDKDGDPENASPAGMTAFNNQLFFKANDGVNGIELYTYNTTNGTALLKDIRPGTDNSSPNNFIDFNNTLYFTAYNPALGGVDLFTADGSSVTAAPFYGATFSGAFNPAVLDNSLYFVGLDAKGVPNKLLNFNDTARGEVADTGTGEEAVIGGAFIPFNEILLLYMDYSTETDTVGRELYEYNPTTDLFTLILDIDPGPGDASISNFTALNNAIYFEADDALFKTDGTAKGTVVITAVQEARIKKVNKLYAWNDLLFFEGDDGTTDQLWVYDPTKDSVINISVIEGKDHNPSDFVPFDGQLFYSGEDAADDKSNLFMTDGSSITQIDNKIIDIDDLAVLDDILYFEGNEEGVTGRELFSFDPAVLSVASVTANERIAVFPNPTNNILNFSEDVSKATYELYTISGKKISDGMILRTSLQLNADVGVYFLKVKTSLNEILVKRIIID